MPDPATPHPVLKLRDGFADTTPALRGAVHRLQRALRRAGHDAGDDGIFGRDTEEAVRAFQQSQGLEASGVVDEATWQALERATEPLQSLLAGFRGDLGWVHDREGYAGKAYWPGGQSGVTLDPGVDLGFAQPPLVEQLYRDALTPEQMDAVRAVFGVKGPSARAALRGNPVLGAIRITRPHADRIFPFAARPYWEAIVRRFPTITAPDTLPAVHTVMLSLSYNRGAGNRALSILQVPLARKDWQQVAHLVGAMQQDHPLPGIRERRRLEAALIRAELGE